MKLPNADQAYVPKEKLLGDLLSESHPVGQSKAKYFRALGFDEATVDQLEEQLLQVARSEEVVEEEATAHGVKYAVEGSVQTPRRGQARVRTVWMVDAGADRPRFVTAYPA